MSDASCGATNCNQFLLRNLTVTPHLPCLWDAASLAPGVCPMRGALRVWRCVQHRKLYRKLACMPELKQCLRLARWASMGLLAQ